FQAAHQVGGNIGDVSLNGVPCLFTRDDQLGEVLVEDVADHLDGEVRFAVERLRGEDFGGRGLAFDALPLSAQPVDVVGEFLFRGTFRCGADNDAGVL